jgi:hypothetical protein
MEFVVSREVKLSHLLGSIANKEDEVYWIGAGDLVLLDLVEVWWLLSILGATLENRLETGGVL